MQGFFRFIPGVLGSLLCLSLQAEPPQAPAILADQIVVLKAERKLRLLNQGKLLREYQVALGFTPKGPKQVVGDGKTPEGHYRIDSRNPHSKYHLSLHISYPSPAQVRAAQKLGRAAGGMIMIHGLPDAYAYLGRLHRQHDWTEGCIAVTNEEIEEIWRLVPDGTPIEIKP